MVLTKENTLLKRYGLNLIFLLFVGISSFLFFNLGRQIGQNNCMKENLKKEEMVRAEFFSPFPIGKEKTIKTRGGKHKIHIVRYAYLNGYNDASLIGYNMGLLDGSIKYYMEGLKSANKLQTPALFATNDKIYDSVIPRIYICNNTLNEYESVKLIVNYKSSGGGYKRRISKLEAGNYQYAGMPHFFNERGGKFPDGNVVVSLKFVGYRNGEKVEFEGLVFNPQ